MHLLVPHASALADAATHVVRDLALPNLSRLLARLAPTQRDCADAATLSPPHERAYATVMGWRGDDGCLPFGARSAQADGIEVGTQAWGLVTPVHWHVSSDHVRLTNPAALDLSDAESRAAFDAVRALFETEGLRCEWGAPARWYVAHESLAAVPCASLDRVIGRPIEPWLRPSATPAGRLVQRLQSEVQLLLYPHPLNEAREQRGALTLNSFWLSGCGRWQRADHTLVQVDDRLRSPLLDADWEGWAAAWHDLDEGPIERLLAAEARGEETVLTLCGERAAQRYERASGARWPAWVRRWRAGDAAAALEAL
jgi:hypothetical protein